MRQVPDILDAPASLWLIDGHCGPLTFWWIATYFRKRISVAGVTRGCRYTKKHGTFMICLAAALSELNLICHFGSDSDPKPHRMETAAYRRARNLGVHFSKPSPLETLFRKTAADSVAIISFKLPSEEPHMTPLLRKGGQAFSPLDGRSYPISQIERGRRAEGILRQSIIVTSPSI